MCSACIQDYVPRIGRTGRAGKEDAAPGQLVFKSCMRCSCLLPMHLHPGFRCMQPELRVHAFVPCLLLCRRRAHIRQRARQWARAGEVVNVACACEKPSPIHSCHACSRAGTAHTFFSGQTDKARAGELINVLREAGQQVPPELLAFGTTVKKKESKLYGAHFKEVDFSQKASKVTFDSDSD